MGMGLVVPTDAQWVEYVFSYNDRIQWFNRDGGGFIAEHGGLTIRLSGSSMARICLSFSNGLETYCIFEPMPVQAAHLGKWVAWFNRNVLQKQPTPLSKETLKEIELKKRMNELMSYVAQQCLKRSEEPAAERKLKARLWDVMTEDFPFRK